MNITLVKVMSLWEHCSVPSISQTGLLICVSTGCIHREALIYSKLTHRKQNLITVESAHSANIKCGTQTQISFNTESHALPRQVCH